MASPRPRLRARRQARRTLIVVVTVVLMGLSSLLLAGPAAGDPTPPPNASEGQRKLAEAQHHAVALTEQWHAAKDELNGKLAVLHQAKTAAAAARRTAGEARAAEERFRPRADSIIMTAFESGRLDQLNALLASDSPEQFVDQMTVLETFTTEQRAVLQDVLAAVENTRRAENEAAQTTSRAEAAAADAARVTDEIGKRKRAAEERIAEVQRMLDQLSPAEREARRSPDVAGPGEVAGKGVGAAALRAAMGMKNRPYQWGAEGPGSFDCSGLVYWAFKKVGVTLPRSSSQQAGVGRAVSRSSLQPGDLVFFYDPISHVGFYAGQGKVFHAPQAGDVVGFADLDSMPFATARRV